MEASAQIEADRSATHRPRNATGLLPILLLLILAIGREIGNSLIQYNGLSLSVKHSKTGYCTG